MLPARDQIHRRIYKLVDHWEGLRPSAKLLPGRQHFDPMEVPDLLPNIYLLAVVGDSARFQFRLLGEAILSSGGPGRKGLFVDEIPRTDTKAYLHDQLTSLVKTHEPIWYKGPPTLRHHKDVMQLEGVMLPLAANGVDVDRCLCMTVYYWVSGRVT